MKFPEPQESRRGRRRVPEELRLVVGGLRLTRDQWNSFYQLGGVVWLRSAIKRAVARKQE